MKKNVIIISVAAAIIILAAALLFIYNPWKQNSTETNNQKTDKTTENVSVKSMTDNELADLMIAFEDDLGLEQVLISQAEDVLIVRFKAPTITGDELNEGLAQIFGYANANTPEFIKTIRLVFVVNNVDSAIVETSKDSITEWTNGKIENSDFIKTFKKSSLLKTEKQTSLIPTAYAFDLCPANSHIEGTDCICNQYYKAVSGECVHMDASEICPIANSHQEGDKCICNEFYKASDGQCVPMDPSEICPIANSHQEGDQCICDQYFKSENGQCVPMDPSEICSTPNSHQEGDNCVCDEGYGSINGVCTLKTSICADHHAKYNASIDDCECNEGYEKNAEDTDCVPVKTSTTSTNTTTSSSTTSEEPKTTTTTSEQPATTTKTETPSTTETTKTNENQKTETSAPQTSAPLTNDPTQVILNLQNDSQVKISVDPLININISTLPTNEQDLIKKQQESIQDFTSTPASEEFELPATSEQKMNVTKAAIAQLVGQDVQKWENELKQAESEKKLKNEEDKVRYNATLSKEENLALMIKQNQDALNIMHKQQIQIMNAEASWSGVMYVNDKQFNNAPKRDFMKESQGDPNLALVYSTGAISEQMKLIQDLKNELRTSKEERMKMLNVREKPTFENEIKKINFYK